MTDADRRVIEDYLPIQAISAEASREKSVRTGHISTLHLWWARRPLVACRAAVYGALVPATQFVPENGVDHYRKSLGRANAAKFVTQLCKYPGSPDVLAQAQQHILRAHAERLTWERGQTVTAQDILEDRAPRPKVLDMFAGGGAIPLEALRLGCDAYALELNPVAHIIELCTLVYPQKCGQPDPAARGSAKDGTWAGLAAEVRHWGRWVLERVKQEVGDLYPPIPDPHAPKTRQMLGQAQLEMAGPGFEMAGQQKLAIEAPSGYLTPVAYLWTRSVRCKNASCGTTVPLVRQTWLSKRSGRCAALRMVAPAGEKKARFQVVEAASEQSIDFNPAAFSQSGNATCPFCGTVADADYVMQQGKQKRVGSQLMAVVCTKSGSRRRYYVAGTDLADALPSLEEAVEARIASASLRIGADVPAEPINPLRPSPNARGLSAVTRHGLTTFSDLFTVRQRLLLLTLVASVRDAHKKMLQERYSDAHAKAVVTYLACSVDREAENSSTLCRWNANAEKMQGTFGRQALAMVWDFCETNAFGGSVGDWMSIIELQVNAITGSSSFAAKPAAVARGSATALPWPNAYFDAIITDPPYYDNVPYADVSDFFYVWLRRTIGELHKEHFTGELTPKRSEATALASRYSGDMHRATSEYERMMLRSFEEAYRVLKSGAPMVVVYAHKTTLGWATLVNSLKQAQFMVTEAWPLDTEMKTRVVAMETAALACSIFLVSRKREGHFVGSYETDVQPALEKIVRERVDTLWELNVSGADLVIAAIGAGLQAFTRFARVEYANGEEVPAERFLIEVEGVVLETLLERIFGVSRSGVAAVDGPSRFYVLWRYTYRSAPLDAGEAIVFTYGQPVELDGPRGLSTGNRALVQKKGSKYRLLDFTERGHNEHLGLAGSDGGPAPLIDMLHRLLWLMEHEPYKIPLFLDEARPDTERLRLVAQALAGAGLKGASAEDTRALISTTSPEQSALGKLTANWRSVVEQHLRPMFAR